MTADRIAAELARLNHEITAAYSRRALWMGLAAEATGEARQLGEQRTALAAVQRDYPDGVALQQEGPTHA